jgi:hypothetical protein
MTGECCRRRLIRQLVVPGERFPGAVFSREAAVVSRAQAGKAVADGRKAPIMFIRLKFLLRNLKGKIVTVVGMRHSVLPGYEHFRSVKFVGLQVPHLSFIA